MTASPSLISQLHANNDFFDSIVNMFPSALYLTTDAVVDESQFSSKYKKGSSAENKTAKKLKNKELKADKFKNMESTIEKKKRKWDANSDDDDDDAAADDSDNDDSGNDSDASTSSTPASPLPASPTATGSRIDALRAKLATKIEAKRQGRPETQQSDSTNISKRAARKQAKKDRIEAAKKKAKTAGFSNAENTSKGKLGGGDDTADVDMTDAPAPSASEDLAGIDFGQVIGLKKKKGYENNKSLANQGKKQSLERMLEEAEAKKEKLRKLKSSDDATDREKAANIEWGDALKAADGERVRDDPAMIKKAMKRKEKKKQKSEKMWNARIETTADSMHEKQKIRKHNLKQRALGGEAGQSLSSKKIKDTEEEKAEAKRKRLGPHAMKGRDDKEGGEEGKGGGKKGAGFEGKKQGFLNKDKGEKGGKKSSKAE